MKDSLVNKGFGVACGRLRAFALLVFMPACILFSAAARAADTEVISVDCDAHQGACRASLDGVTVEMDIMPKPVKAMRDLTFRVTVSGKPLEAPPFIDLGMPGMKMGPNRVRLEPSGNGTYSGKGIIVRCPSGRRTWFARITLSGMKTVKFTFDVLY